MALVSPSAIKNVGLDIENADGTTLQDLLTAGSVGARVDSIAITSDDTANMDVLLYLNNGTDDFLIGRIAVVAGSGTDGTNHTVKALNETELPFLKDDLSYYLQATYKLRVAVVAAVTAAKKLTITAWYGDY